MIRWLKPRLWSFGFLLLSGCTVVTSSEVDWVSLQGGCFEMGNEDAYPEERPTQRVCVDSFEIGRTEITNVQFSAFIDATGYVTSAERGQHETGLPPGSAIFDPDFEGNALSWWKHQVGANWKQPDGPAARFAKPNEPTELKSALTRVLEDRLLGDAKTRLLIPSVHAPDNKPRNFKTRHAERFIRDPKRLAVEVCMATAAAPTFFKAHEMSTGELMIDGGVMANNPIAMAAVEGVGELGWSREDVRILSISCLSSPTEIPEKVGGAKFLMKHTLDVFSNVASENAIGMAQILLGEHGGNDHKAIYRIDTTVAPKSYALDATERIRHLKSLGRNKSLHEFVKIKDVFFETEADPFNPIPMS